MKKKGLRNHRMIRIVQSGQFKWMKVDGLSSGLILLLQSTLSLLDRPDCKKTVQFHSHEVQTLNRPVKFLLTVHFRNIFWWLHPCWWRIFVVDKFEILVTEFLIESVISIMKLVINKIIRPSTLWSHQHPLEGQFGFKFSLDFCVTLFQILDRTLKSYLWKIFGSNYNREYIDQ